VSFHPRLIWRIARDPLRVLERAGARGPVVAVRAGGRRFIFIRQPAIVREVLVKRTDRYAKGFGLRGTRPVFGDGLLTSSGETWRHDRSALRAFFDAERVDDVDRLADAAVARHRPRLTPAGGEAIDLERWAADVVWSVLAAAFFPGWPAERLDHMHRLVDALRADLALLFQVRRYLPWSVMRRRAVIVHLDRLLRSAADVGASPTGLAGRCGQCGPREIDQLRTFLVAGYDTTAWALAAALSALDERVGQAPRSRWTLDDAERHCRETLRLYPPIWIIPRRAMVDDAIHGLRIARGTDILISPYLVHRDPDLWPDPLRFEPDRFLPARRDEIRPGAYLPFGLGPRSCIGERVALALCRRVVAAVADGFVVATRRARLRLQVGLTLRSRLPLMALLAPRAPTGVALAARGEPPLAVVA